MHFHYLEEYSMDKAEILEKSRKENKGRDISEDEQSKNAARFGVVFGVCFIVIITFLSIAAGSKMMYGVVATEFCILFAMNLYNAIKRKTAKFILMAVSNAIPFVIFTFITVCEMFQVFP